MSNKGPLALRTISEAADAVGVQQHVLRFWETKFPFIRPTKRAGGRRFYRPQDIDMLSGIKTLLYDRGYTIRGVQKLYKDEGQQAILTPSEGIPGGFLTEQGLVPAEQVKNGTTTAGRQPAYDYARDDMDRVQQISSETRDRFLAIAKSLEEAQEALGRHIGRHGGRMPGRGQVS